MALQTRNIFRVKAGKVGLIFLTFLGLYLISFTVYPHSEWNNYLKLSPLKIVFDILITLLLSVCIIELCLYIDRKMNRYLPWSEHTTKRLILQTGIQVLSLFVLLIIYASLTVFTMHFLDIRYEFTNSKESNVIYFTISITFLTLIVSMLNTVIFLSSNWKKEIVTAAEYKIKAAESKQLAIQTELQALRLQLDPHFVFNNLSVLSELILKDRQLGFEYTENFSKVYRYLLINAKKQLISLRDEIKFLYAYLFLLKNRMGDGVVFEIDISETQMNLHLPPITLQLLVENAIKHNRIEKENPLRIKIYTNQTNELIIENTLFPLLKSPVSSGLGLENIMSRYAILSDRKPQIIQTDTTFIVKIPLLK